MKKTYDEIYKNMRDEFTKECNVSPKISAEMDAVIAAAATEIYGVEKYVQYVENAAFAQSATGDDLDRHGEIRSLTRKSGSKSFGTLTFFLSEASAEDVTVPKGTICSEKDKAFIQFETTDDAVIRAGEMSADAPAEARSIGDESNAEQGMIVNIVNPPAKVTAVTNDNPFCGGAYLESDEMFAKRIVASYEADENGINARSMERYLMDIDDVLDAKVTAGDSDSSLNVYLKTRTGDVSENLKSKVTDVLGICSLFSVSLNIVSANIKNVDISSTVNVIPGYDKDTVVKTVQEKTKNFFSACRIGEVQDVDKLKMALLIDGVCGVTVHSNAISGDEIDVHTGEYIVLHSGTVNVNE